MELSRRSSRLEQPRVCDLFKSARGTITL